jgi:choline-sulfatase
MSHVNPRPNFLFIMDDQHRFDYLGCAGADYVATPHTDRLAELGVRFDQAFTTCPLCAPARIALTSGLNPTRLGALDNHAFFPLRVPTFFQRLRNHGYQVGMAGKHDLAKHDYHRGRWGDRPVNFALGFTHPHETLGKMEAGIVDRPFCPYTHWLDDNGLFQSFHQDYRLRREAGWISKVSHDSVLPTEAFHDVYLGNRAVEWIENVSGEFPWLFFVGFVGPHDPFDPPQEYAERYRDTEMPDPIASAVDGKPSWQRLRRREMEPEEIALTRRQYCASIEAIDHQVGLMLDALEKRNMMDHTYVVFCSDHGEMLGDHSMYTKGVPYEASTRVPLIVAGPGIGGGQVSDSLIELSDINPTICELAGLAPHEHLDARSFHGVLFDASEKHRDDVMSIMRNWRMIRTERFKFVDNYNDLAELYDLQEDPHELINIAEANLGLVKDFRRQLTGRVREGKWLR